MRRKNRQISQRIIVLSIIALAILISGCTGGGGGADSAGYSFDGSNLEGTGAGKTLTISGTLVDANGNSIPAATVTTPEGTSTVTDSDGRFSLLAEESSAASLTFTTKAGSFEVPLGSTDKLEKLSFTAAIVDNQISANNIAVEPDKETVAPPTPTPNSNFSPHEDSGESQPEEPTQSPSNPNVTATPATPPPTAICGDGIIDPSEQCDDGNLGRGDGCGPACRLEECGNGIFNLNEQCDDGNIIAGDGCSESCKLE